MALSLTLLTVGLLGAFSPDPPDLTAEFEAACMGTRGAAAGVEAAALARGYAPVGSTQEEEAGSDRADPPPRVWSRGEDDYELRIVSAPGRMRLTGPWLSVDRCYVTGPGDFNATRAAAGRLTGVDPIRQRQTAVFAWTEEADGRQGCGRPSSSAGPSPCCATGACRWCWSARIGGR